MPESHTNYSPSAVEAYPNKTSVVVQTVQQRAGHSHEGQQFSGIYVEQEPSNLKAPTVVRLGAVFSDSGNVDQQYTASQYASGLPDYNYMFIDLPGHGQSDPLTKAQRRAIKNSGELGPVSEAQVEAALDIAGDLEEIMVVGEAVGELMALSFAVQAAKRGVNVRHIFGVDPVGMERRSPVTLATNYLLNAQKSRNQRRHPSDDAGEQRLEESFRQFEAGVAKKYGPTKHATQPGHIKKMAKERAIATFMLRKSPFTRDTGVRLLDSILSTSDVRVDLIFGGRSSVGRPTPTVISNLQELQAASSQDQFRYDIWPHDNQDLGLARHQPRIVNYVADHVEG